MGAEFAGQCREAGGEEHCDFAVQPLQMMTDEHRCLCRRCHWMQPYEGFFDLIQRAGGQKAIAQ